ncbi:DNA polymerase III subunit chi [Aquincola tertiaricarbonis]|uniref:DNA polymerase III subunit chi n=1 Tax=Aquincola tertiaricarbonis TaxID=391953 RepID=UPI001E5BD8A9|nr:DNA polymerase III subunit chi [Aquincola tertiaricarbonis]
MPATVEFHTGMADKIGFACRLLRKAYARGARVAVTGAPELLRQLDDELWLFEPQQFVPHVRLKAGQQPAPRLLRTPLWLLDAGAEPPHREVLVNLGPAMAEGPDDFQRVIELVGGTPEDRDAGRRRWRAWEAAGAKIVHHAQQAPGGPAPGPA